MTREEKFTNGPWTFSAQRGTPGHCFQAQVWDNTGHTLACIEPTEHQNEATANARLIAVAPDMYEALRDIMILIESENVDGDFMFAIRKEMKNQLIHKIKAAISKANPQLTTT